MFYNENVYYLLCSCTNPILEKSCSWDIGQNALSQSDCMIFKWLISLEQIEQIWFLDSKISLSQEWTHRINCFFTFWYKFMQIKRWLNILWVGMVKNRCGQLCDRTQKLTVFEEWTDWLNWIFACWYRFPNIKS